MGLEPIPQEERPCTHLEHNPPTHLYIPPGMRYRHICPGCHKVTVLTPPQITW